MLGISDWEIAAGRRQPEVLVIATHYDGPECPSFVVEDRPDLEWFFETRVRRCHPRRFHLYGENVNWGRSPKM